MIFGKGHREFGALIAATVTLGATAVAAAEPELVSQHDDWAAYTYENASEGKVCYAVSQPEDMAPKNVNRDPVYFLVTNRPGKNVRNEVSVIIGYPYKKGSKTTADIGGAKFSLFTSGDGAWIETGTQEQNLVDAMKRGTTMTISGTSWRGTQTTDRYSLSGVTAAIDAIGEACK